jgi:hypothetical protein
MTRLNKVLQKCFRKIRLKKKKPIEVYENLYNRWKEIKCKTDPESVKETEYLEAELADDYFKKIKEAAEHVESDDGGSSSNKLWELKKQLCPRSRDPPTAMLDPEGNLVKAEESIKELAVKAYTKRLENRQINDDLVHIKEAKEKLAIKLMEVAKHNKTPPWTPRDMDKVLNQLKTNKSRDPYGLANEIFKKDVAGSDLKKALLNLMNRIKD